MRKILFYNPNSSQEVTEKVLEVARRHARPGTEVVGHTSLEGPPYIGSAGDLLQAAAVALAWVRQEAARYDAIVVACFGDTGISTLRQVSPVPLIGLIESSVMAAQLMGERYSIVTGGDEWKRLLPPMIKGIGQESRLASIRTLGQSGLQLLNEPVKAYEVIAAETEIAANEDGADVVILGGAALAGMDAHIRPAARAKVIDCVAPAVWMAESI